MLFVMLQVIRVKAAGLVNRIAVPQKTTARGGLVRAANK